MNVICVKWGSKYPAYYVNRLFNMLNKNMPIEFNFYCYTDNSEDFNSNIKIIPIETDLESWWNKIELLNIFDKGENILLDLDIVILNPLERLCSIKTRTVSVLYSQWKEGFLKDKTRYPTLYNSSIMKWYGDQGKEIYNYFNENKQLILFKYSGIDRYLFNEPVQVDILPTSIAYSYWKGVRYGKDTVPEKLRNDYEICIVNHNPKMHEINSWILNYWK